MSPPSVLPTNQQTAFSSHSSIVSTTSGPDDVFMSGPSFEEHLAKVGTRDSCSNETRIVTREPGNGEASGGAPAGNEIKKYRSKFVDVQDEVRDEQI